MQDEIIAELWAVKDDIAKSFDYDIESLFEYFKSAEKTTVLTPSKEAKGKVVELIEWGNRLADVGRDLSFFLSPL